MFNRNRTELDLAKWITFFTFVRAVPRFLIVVVLLIFLASITGVDMLSCGQGKQVRRTLADQVETITRVIKQ